MPVEATTTTLALSGATTATIAGAAASGDAGVNTQVYVVLAILAAAELEVEIIVMGTVCRTGLAGFFIGNTAEGVLRDVDCSLLTVKPDGFETPVELEDG